MHPWAGAARSPLFTVALTFALFAGAGAFAQTRDTPWWSTPSGTAQPNVTTADQSKIPPRPDEPRAAKAYAVFDTYCARCHQTGRLELPLASGGLANILSIGEIARNPVLVKPGSPDASRLYDVFESRHAPLDVFSAASAASEPKPEDIQTVREWIRDLAPVAQACTSRKPVTSKDIDQMMQDELRIQRDDAPNIRFISLVHLYNACASADEMTAYAQALNKLMNSLSRAAEPMRLQALDAAGTLFSFQLSEVGWTSADWKLIEEAYPPSTMRAVPKSIAQTAGTKLPMINGDWLAANAAETPLYYALLKVPQKFSELAQIYEVNIEANIKAQTVRRIALKSSAVTRGNRLIERHPSKRGSFWLVYDFATSTGDQDIFEHPEGPKSATAASGPFKPDQVRAIYALPNGFLGFALYDAAGNRIDRVLPGLEKQYAGAEADTVEPTTTAGANCFACHTDGLVKAADEFRNLIPADSGAPPSPIRQAVMPLFAIDSENKLLMIGDTEKLRLAAKAAGVDLDSRIRGEELVSGLARRYREPADFEAALSETGMSRDAFLSELADAKEQAAPLARRLLHGILSRTDLDRLFALLKGIDAPAQVASAGFLRQGKTDIGLTLWIDKPRPVPGDLITVKAEADNDCYLTIVSVDAEGKGTVLFPNDFESDNLLIAGEPVSVPSDDAPFQLRYKAEGSETLLARCSTSARPPIGIEHDFERQRFTVLGNWENFIQDTLETEAEMRRNPEKAERARIARTADERTRRARGERVDIKLDVSTPRPLRDGRAVLVLGPR